MARQWLASITQRFEWRRASFVIGCVVGTVMPVQAQGTFTVFSPLPAPGQATELQPGPQDGLARVSLNVADSTLDYAIHEVARQAHMQLAYDRQHVTLGQRVTVHISNVTVSEALAKLTRGTRLTAVVTANGETIVIRNRLAGAVTDHAQFAAGTIAGKVIDSASGQGLGGAAVRIQGTKLSAITSDSGNFTLHDVPGGEQVLSVRLFGYKPADRTVTVVDSQRTIVRIVMVSVPTVLSGVVTTAVGLQRKIEVGSDITTLNVDSIMKVAPVTSMTDLLETRVPGMTVLHSDGVPGDPSRIRLRGVGSVQLNNDPVVIVDGVRVYASQSDPRNKNLAHSLAAVGTATSYNAPSPLDQIDPNNIESVEVLKGPSATAIYGSDAANGVIVVTTKRGRAGPTHWNLSLSDGVNWLPGDWPNNYYRFGSSDVHDSQMCVWYDASCRPDSLVAFQALNDPRYTLFTHGNDREGNLTISGGTPTLTYSVTGSAGGTSGYLKLPTSQVARYDSLYGSTYGEIPQSLVHPDQYTTWSLGGQVTAQPYPTLNVTLQSSLFSGRQQHSALESAITQLEGEYIGPLFETGPLIAGEYERATDDQLTSTNAVSARWQPRPWLPMTLTAGINTIQRTDMTYVPFGIYDQPYSGNVCDTQNDCADTTGSYGLGRGSSRNQTLNVGTSIPLFAQKVTLSVGGNLYSESTADFNVYTNQLSPGVSVPTTFLTNVGCSGSADLCNSQTMQNTTNQSTYGWYVQPQFNMASRFFAAPGFRLDGGSGAASSAGSVSGLSAFPKMDLSYVAIDQQGKRPLWGVVSLFRPRFSFGLAGTQPAPADKLRLFNAGTYQSVISGQQQGLVGSQGCSTVTLDGTTYVQAVCFSALGNTQLRPERTSELEGGFDLTLWQNRLSLTYTQYDKTRHDAILDIPVAQSVYSIGGAQTSIEKNIGVIRNTGTEMTVSATVLQSRAIGWTLNANLSNDNNLVVRLNPGQGPIILNSALGSTNSLAVQERAQAGYPLFGIFARPIIGYNDSNSDGIIEGNEVRYGDSVVYVGQPNPKYQFNLSSDLTLLNGRLGVHMTFAYQNGMTQTNQGDCTSGAFLQLPNNPSSTLATQAAMVAARCGTGFSSAASEIGLMQTVNTFRFNDLSINYILPRAFSNWLRASNASIALQGSNLALHSNYRGIDPDVNASTTTSFGDQTVDAGQIPEPRMWRLQFTLGN